MGAVFRKHPTQAQPVPRAQVRTEHPAQGFDPRHLSTDPLVWCRADAGVRLNGSTASSWEDMSGNGNDFSQATASAQPTLKSSGLGERPELRFDGSDDCMLGLDLYGGLSNASYWTIVVVMQGWSYGGGGNPWTAEGILGAPSGGANYFNVGSTAEAHGSIGFQNYDGSSNQSALSGATDLDEGVPLVAVIATDNGTGLVRANGQQGTSNANTSSLNSNATTVKLGKGPRSDVQTPDFYSGALSEVLIFDGALRPNELGALEDYLADRYGVRMGG
ncbi:hypothetical protein CMI37_06300 [Candidatus Pacearchaeota archaeon]|nr:hypothetical protein [Candidatus Pacearchaeota archaeon]|tara:strand:- start:39 stop:863 length:825 start_codon:yes stop_codon:yes gene_type:complete